MKSINSTKINTKNKTITNNTEINNTTATKKDKSSQKSFTSLKKRITRKSYRKYDIERVGLITDIIPKFIKFYNKLDNNHIMAVKYYKGIGSRFQTEILTNYKQKKGEPRKLKFPFNYIYDQMLYNDIIGKKTSNLLPILPSIDIKDIQTYIKNSYSTRIELLNRLDEIYNMKDCPKMSGKEILFRGMSETPELKKLKVGDTYTFKNFISTTVNKNTAENFSTIFNDNSYVFILMNMKDIPFLYMPGNKLTSDKKYSKFMIDVNIFGDFSEYTLPRNLEFTIEKIEENYLTHGIYSRKKSSYKTLINTMKKLEIISSDENTLEQQNVEQNQDANTQVENTNNTNTKNTKNKIIEKHIFQKAKFIYCTFKTWHPREPIKWENISKDAEYILDKSAANTWKNSICPQTQTHMWHDGMI